MQSVSDFAGTNCITWKKCQDLSNLQTKFKIALDAGSWIRHFSRCCPWPEQLFGTNHRIHICMRFVFLWNSNIWGCAPHPWEDWHSYGFWRSWEIRLSLFFPFSFLPSSNYSASFLFIFFSSFPRLECHLAMIRLITGHYQRPAPDQPRIGTQYTVHSI